MAELRPCVVDNQAAYTFLKSDFLAFKACGHTCMHIAYLFMPYGPDSKISAPLNNKASHV